MSRKNIQPKFNGTRIAERRREVGLSQDELGDAANITRYQIIRIEKGQSGSIDSLRAICRKLDLPINEVLDPGLTSPA